MTIRLTLPYPPSANRYWRHNRGRIHRSAEAEAYKHHVGLLCNAADIWPVEHEVALDLVFFRPAKRMDLDNMLKVLLDALQGHAYINDSQVAEIHATRMDDKANPRVEVEIQGVI